MKTPAKPKAKAIRTTQSNWYRGKQAKTGNSLGLRFDKTLFRSHPEFNGVVKARVIAPGRMLVVAQPPSRARYEEDPVIASFLSFLASDMTRTPQRVTPLDETLVNRINRITGDVESNPNEGLGDGALI